MKRGCLLIIGTRLLVSAMVLVSAPAVCVADIVVGATGFSYCGSAQSYTVPPGAQYVVVKAWGAGGGTGFGAVSGGGGGFATARFEVAPGQSLTIKVGGPGACASSSWPQLSGGGWNGGGNACDVGGGGGGATVIIAPSGTVWAAGGGGAGWSNSGSGGAGGGAGGQNGSAGGTTASGAGGGGATTSSGGIGGSGVYGENGDNGSQGQGGRGGTDGGYRGAEYVDWVAAPGGGGGGYYGGGGGGTGDRISGGGGGGGGSSNVIGTASQVSYFGGNGSSPGATSDPYYPGGSVGYGASASFSTGNPGYAVIVSYQIAGPPIINSSLSQRNLAQNQYDSYTISAAYNPTSYSASGLPPGLTLNSGSGVIAGYANTPGTYNAIISASNSYGTGSATVTWAITAASINLYGSVSPSSAYNGSLVTLTRDGSANFGIAWFENSVLRPNSTWISFGNTPAGSMNWVPDGGPGTYYYVIRLVDNYNNYRDQYIQFQVTQPTVSPPTVVQFSTAASTFVSLSWSGAGAQAGISSYRVYRDGVFVGSTASGAFTDSTVAPWGTYSYVVYTVDVQGNVSVASQPLTVTTARPLEVFTPLP